MSVCFYCKDPKVSVCMCLGCRTRLEMAQAELERLRKDQALRSAAYWEKIRSKGPVKRKIK